MAALHRSTHRSKVALLLQRDVSTRFFILFISVCLLIPALVARAKHIALIRPGPDLEVALTAMDIWSGRSISSPRYYTLYTQLRAKSAQDRVGYWQDVFAMTESGILVPKHSILLSLIAAPFYGAFGEFGFWLLLQLAIVGSLIALRSLLRDLLGRDYAIALLALGVGGTQLLFYSYGLSYDILALVLITMGTALLTRRPLWGAFVLTSSCLIRPSFLMLSLPLLLSWVWFKRAALVDCLTGFAVALFLLFGWNSYLWGNPFITVYQRYPFFSNGEVIFPQGVVKFTWHTFIAEWPKKLFGKEVGLISYNPVLPLLIVLPLIVRRASRLNTLLVAWDVIFIVNALVLYSYEFWDISPYGNRYLLPVIALWLVPGISAIDALLTRRR